jgi:polysaccharide transporter, PST family
VNISTRTDLATVSGFTDATAGLRWTTVTAILVRVMVTSRSLLLARLIGPSAFGLVAGVLVVTSLVSLTSELGLTSYLVYRGTRARDEARILGSYAGGSGLLGAALVVGLSGVIADFYREPVDHILALALSVTILLSTISALPVGVLRSQLRFRELGLIQVASEAAGLVIAVLLVVGGAGLWALVSVFVTVPAVTVTSSWFASGMGWPRIKAGWTRVSKAALRYGGRLASGAVLWAIAFQADNAVIGRSLGATALGLYAVAYSYGTLPGVTVGSIVGQVAFPVFALSAADRDQLRNRFLRFTRISATVGLPLAALSLGLSGPIVDWLLGPRWTGVVGPLQLFLLMGAIRGLFPTAELLRALGRVNVELALGAVAAPAVVFAAAFGSRGGIILVAMLVTAIFVTAALAAAWLAVRAMAVPLRTLMLTLLPGVALAAAVGLTADEVASHLRSNPAIAVVLGATAAMVLYASIVYFTPAGSEIKQIIVLRR